MTEFKSVSVSKDSEGKWVAQLNYQTGGFIALAITLRDSDVVFHHANAKLTTMANSIAWYELNDALVLTCRSELRRHMRMHDANKIELSPWERLQLFKREGSRNGINA